VKNGQKVLLLLVLMLVAATSWFFRDQEGAGDTAAVTGGGPDAYADDVTIRVMNAAGRPVYHLRAEHMAWFPNGDQLTLRRPQLDVTRDDGTLWVLTAEQGRTGSASDPILLTGEVIIQRVASASQNPLKITTSDVTIKPDVRLAETGRPARIDGTGFRFETQGLTADFIDNRLELHSQVRGHIDGNG
jgi:lipopolysaccharide export system protein LptC